MPKISLYKNIASASNAEEWDFIEYLEAIRDGYWEDIVNVCRNIKDKEQRNTYKDSMPTATMSGLFARRSDSGLLSHSGYLAMDLDDVEDINQLKSILIRDKYVFSVFMSVSGNGLRVIFIIEPSKHKEAFRGISEYLFRVYGLTCIDRNGIFVSKPFIVSFDPHLFIRYEGNTTVFQEYIPERVIKKMPSFIHTNEDFSSVLKQITGRAINICESYEDWLKVGLAISEELGESGRDAFHQVSQFSSKYKYETADKQYNQCLKANGSDKVGISSFYYLAKLSGVSISTQRTLDIVRTTRNGKRAGLDKKAIVKNLKEFKGIDGADNLVDSVFDSPYKDEYTDDEQSLVQQLEMFIQANYQLRINEVTGHLEQNGTQVTPNDLNSIYISAKKELPKLDYQLLVRLLKSDATPIFNPFYEYLNSDGIATLLPANPSKEKVIYDSPLIDELASCIINDDPEFTRFFLRKWLVSIISSMHKVHSPLLFALTGRQGTGKTEFFRNLLPKGLLRYYSESKLDKGKDDELLMCECILLMDDELGGKSKSDTLKFNNLSSTQYFYLRRPYGDHNERILRLAVLCGTSNYKAIIKDPTGNRRSIIVKVDDIDKDKYNSIDKHNLLFEIYGLYRQKFDWRITYQDTKMLNKDIEEYQESIKERDLLQMYYISFEDCPSESRMSTTDILVELEKLTNLKLSIVILGRELDASGYVRKTTRRGTATPKLWCVDKIGRFGQQVDKKDMPF